MYCNDKTVVTDIERPFQTASVEDVYSSRSKYSHEKHDT